MFAFRSTNEDCDFMCFDSSFFFVLQIKPAADDRKCQRIESINGPTHLPVFSVSMDDLVLICTFLTHSLLVGVNFELLSHSALVRVSVDD